MAPDVDAGRSKERLGLGDRQTHHAGVTALQRGNEYTADTLDTVRARFVTGFSGGPVGFGFWRFYGPESYPRSTDHDLNGFVYQGYARKHFVRTA